MTEPFTRINLTIPSATQDMLIKTIPHGLRNAVYLALLEKFAEVANEKGRAATLDVLEGKFEIRLTGVGRD